jgi:hypothetical protein
MAAMNYTQDKITNLAKLSNLCMSIADSLRTFERLVSFAAVLGVGPEIPPH